MRKGLSAFITKILPYSVKTSRSLLLCSILILAFWIRIQMVNKIPEGQFLGNDPYLYYWQAKIISENGHLPARDMHRWLPLGRDLGQTLNLYSYALAYTYKALSFLFPSLSLYQVTLYAPTVCFILGLAALCVFLDRTHGLLFASIVSFLLATFPGSIDRSTAGFSDRDSWCLMLGILAVVTYLAALQAETPRKRLIWTLASGFIVFLGGMSWEGFGVFLSIILCVELWRSLTTETEEGFGLYLLWMLTFVPLLYLASPAYRNGQGFATHLFAFMLVPPLVLLGIRALRILLVSKVKILLLHGRTVALVLTLAGVGTALGYTFMQFDTFTSTTVAFSQNRLMRTIGELHPPHYSDWVRQYGNLFLVASIGFIVTAIHFFGKDGILFLFPLCLFWLTTFFRDVLDTHFGPGLIYNLFFGAVVLISLIGLVSASRHKGNVRNELTVVACATWFLFWITLARDARRYDFFVGLPIAYFATHLLTALSECIAEKLRHSEYTTDKFRRDLPHARLRSGLTLLIFAVLFFWVPPGKQAERFHAATTHIRPILPNNPHLKSAFEWMKTHIPSSVVAASWNDGSQLNVLGGVKTIIDQDHYLQHWIHLYNRHVFCARSNREALQFLKTHEATYLLLYAEDVIFNARSYSDIGSHENGELFTITPLERQLPKDMKYRMVPRVHADIPLESVDFDMTENTLNVKAALKTGETVSLPGVALINKRRVTSETLSRPIFRQAAENKNEHGGVLIVFDEYQNPGAAYYISAIGWNSLAVRLYFRGEIPDIFVPIYPTDGDPSADVKIWKIHYPPDIQPDPKYLKTGIPDIDKDL